MKKHILGFMTTLVLAGGAMANGYCDRTGGAERDRCYETGYRQEFKQGEMFFNKILASSNVSEANKDFIRTDQVRWEGAVRAQCRTWDCYYNSMRDRKMALIVWGTKHGVSFK